MKTIFYSVLIGICVVIIGLTIHVNNNEAKEPDLLDQNVEALALSEENGTPHCCARKPGNVYCPKRHANRKWVMYIEITATFDDCLECDDDSDCDE